MGLIPKITVQVDADTAGAIAQILAASKVMEKSLDDINVKFDGLLDKNFQKDAEKSGEDTSDKFDKGWKKGNEKNSRRRRGAFRRELIKWGSIIAVFGETVGVALYGAAGAITAVSASLLSALGASAALIPIGVGLGAAFGSIAIGLEGVGGALTSINEGFAEFLEDGETSAETLEAIEKALGNLAPAAAAFVTEFQKLLPVFHEIRLAVQEALFAGLADELTDFGPMIEGMEGVLVGFAEAVNGAFIDVLNVLQEIDLVGIFEALIPVTENVLDAFAPLTEAFFGFVEAATPAAELLSEQFLAWAENMADFVGSTEGLESIQGFLDTAVESLGSWMDLIGALGGLIGTVMRTASESGNSLIDSLTGIVNRLDEWLNTPEGQEAFLEFLETGEAVMRALGPVLEGLQGMFQNIVTPEAVERFADLGVSLGEILPALGTLLSLIGQTGALNFFARLLETVGGIIERAEGPLSVLAGAIDSFLVALDPLLATLEVVLGDILGEMALVLAEVLEALEPLIPPLTEFVSIMGSALADAIAGIDWEYFIDSMVRLLEAVIDFAIIIGPPLLLLTEFALQGTLDLIALGFIALAGTINFFSSVLNKLEDDVGDMRDQFLGALEAITEAWDTSWNFMKDLAISVWTAIKDFFIDTWTAIKDFFIDTWQSMGDWFDGLLLSMRNALTNEWTAAKNKTYEIWNAIKGFFVGIWNSIKSTFTTSLSTIKNAVSREWLAAKNKTYEIWNAIKDFLLGFFDDVIGGFKALPGEIASALSGLADIIMSPFKAAWDWIAGLPGRIGGVLDNIPGAGLVGGVLDRIGLAAGGIVNGPTKALIGEAGAEAVIPLTRPLALVDPSVRAMAALIRGENQGGYSSSYTGPTSSQQVTNNWTINDRSGNTEATAQKVLNRMAATMK